MLNVSRRYLCVFVLGAPLGMPVCSAQTEYAQIKRAVTDQTGGAHGAGAVRMHPWNLKEDNYASTMFGG
jgi:hypothetical protein